VSQRPRLLFLAQTLPYPPDAGVAIRTYHVLRLLASAFDVTALCFYRAKSTRTDAALERGVEALRRFGQVEAFPIPQEHSSVRLVGDHLRSLLRRRVYTVPAYESAAFRARLDAHLATSHFDLVHLDSLDLSGYLPRVLQAAPVVCVHHNVESQLLRRRAATEAAGWRRRYLLHQAGLMEREERRWCARLALNVVVSEPDRRELSRLVPEGRFTVVPNGVDVESFQPAQEGKAEEGMVFVGGTNWFPNRDALTYFSEEILPLLRAAGEEAPVSWVGHATEEERRSFAEQHGIELTGYVDDIRPRVHDAACYVVPLRVGGGTRLKVLDAWAMGKAVVSTSVGCEGLHAVDGENVLLRDTPSGFAEAVRAVLHDGELRRRLRREARRTAEELYSWKMIGERMVVEYQALLGGNGEPRAAAPARDSRVKEAYR
jgi:glycosyltransferase involved in cell wall biosynthesis